MRRFRSAAVLAAFTAALAVPTAGHADVTIVGTDRAGDWGTNVDPTLPPVGHELGADLFYAAIGDDGDGVVDFIIGVTNLPESGGTPEVIRYVWTLHVNGVEFELDGKFSNYSRGACDPTSGQCPPPRDPGPQPFFVRGDYVVGPAARTCTEKGIVQAIFNPATDSITVAVPLSLLGVSAGCGIIEPFDNTSFPGGSVVAITSVFFSQNLMPLDLMAFDEDNPVSVCLPE